MITDAELYKYGITRKQFDDQQMNALEGKLIWAERTVEALLVFLNGVDEELGAYAADIYSEAGSQESLAASEIAQQYITVYKQRNIKGVE